MAIFVSPSAALSRAVDRLGVAELLGRHPYHAALAATAAALAGSVTRVELGLALAGAAALLACCLGRASWAPAAAGIVLCATVAGDLRLAATEPAALGARPGQPLERRAILLEHPRPSRFGSSATVALLGPRSRAARLLARAPASMRWPDGVGPGSELVVAGRVRRLAATPDAAGWRAHLRRRGISAELSLTRVGATGVRRGGPAGVVDSMRRRAERALSAGLTRDHAALARGMVLGQDEAIEQMVRDDFRRSGLAHLLAVSGQNVALLGALALPLLGVLGLGFRMRAVALGTLIAVYVPLAGAGPSLQRAALMGGAALVALLAGRPSSRWYGLGLAAVATLALNPRVLGDIGWQLSFAAVAGILVMAPSMRSRLSFLPRPLAEGVAITVAASLATAPLLAHHFATVSIAGLAANLAALPAIAPIMWIGIVQAAVGQALAVPALASVTSAVLELLGRADAVTLAYLGAVAERFASAPGADVAVELASAWAVAGAYAALVAVLLGARALHRRAEPLIASAGGAWRNLSGRLRTAIAVAVGALATAVGAWALSPPAPPDILTVSFLDVGQGDATLVQHPDGAAVLFDGGRREARVERLLERAGVRRLTAIVATHASADHHGGLADVIESVPVDLLVDGGDGNLDPRFRHLLATADRHGVRRVSARAGMTLKMPGLAMRILSPPPRPPGPAPGDPNPRAIAAVVESGGFELFLAGDAESDALARLALPAVDAIKVSHHGSRDPGLPTLLRRLSPQVATIPVGEHNGYGHPAPETLAALRAAVPHVYRTDRDGTVAVGVEAGQMRVTTGS